MNRRNFIYLMGCGCVSIGLNACTSAPITVPVHNDARGHPLLFRQDLLDDINEIQEESYIEFYEMQRPSD